jgi:hypothetical protein
MKPLIIVYTAVLALFIYILVYRKNVSNWGIGIPIGGGKIKGSWNPNMPNCPAGQSELNWNGQTRCFAPGFYSNTQGQFPFKANTIIKPGPNTVQAYFWQNFRRPTWRENPWTTTQRPAFPYSLKIYGPRPEWSSAVTKTAMAAPPPPPPATPAPIVSQSTPPPPPPPPQAPMMTPATAPSATPAPAVAPAMNPSGMGMWGKDPDAEYIGNNADSDYMAQY